MSDLRRELAELREFVERCAPLENSVTGQAARELLARLYGRPITLSGEAGPTPAQEPWATEDQPRIHELLTQHGIVDTDDLKHTLEDHQRWSRSVVQLDVENVSLRDQLAAALRAREEAERARDGADKEAAECRERLEEALDNPRSAYMRQLNKERALLGDLRVYCSDLREGIAALLTAARGDEHGQWWPIRRWMDSRDIFNDDIQAYQRLSEIVLDHLLKGLPMPPLGPPAFVDLFNRLVAPADPTGEGRTT